MGNSIVHDVDGNHKLLCAEYEWDEEDHTQEFGPEQVRKIGQTATVADLLTDAPLLSTPALEQKQSTPAAQQNRATCSRSRSKRQRKNRTCSRSRSRSKR